MGKLDKRVMLNMIREYYDLNRNSKFADFFGITDQHAYAWTKRNNLDYELIYEKCPGISAEWLLSGGTVGEMIKPASQSVNGNNNTTVGRDMLGDSKAIDNLTEALRAEQELNKTSQEHIATLLNLLNNKRDTI